MISHGTKSFGVSTKQTKQLFLKCKYQWNNEDHTKLRKTDARLKD